MTRESSKMMAPVTSPKYWEFQNNNRGQINCVTQLVSDLSEVQEMNLVLLASHTIANLEKLSYINTKNNN